MSRYDLPGYITWDTGDDVESDYDEAYRIARLLVKHGYADPGTAGAFIELVDEITKLL